MLAKLLEGKCIVIGVIGGSISAGHWVHSHETYHAELIKWLNHYYNCSTKTTIMSHTIEHMYDGGLSSNLILNRILDVYKQQLLKCDMLLYETAANDYGSSVSLLAGTGRNSEEVEKTDRKNTLSMISSTELVIRSLWTFHSTLVIWIVAASWRCIGDSVMPPYYCSAAKGHLEVTQYYNIDHISVMHSILPFTNEK